MKKLSLAIASLGFAAAALPVTANAAPWQTINQRQANLNSRINQGIRSGALNRAEASRLRTQFKQLVRLEAQYRRSRPGFTLSERRDLDQRFNVLSSHVRVQKHDRQGRRR